MFSADRFWITIAEVKGFTVDAMRVFSLEEYEALTQTVAMNPTYGEVIPDTGGVRLFRWPAESQGPRGAIRVLYYFRDLNTPVYLLALYERGERLNLTSTDKRIIRLLVEEIVATYRTKWSAHKAFHDGAA